MKNQRFKRLLCLTLSAILVVGEPTAVLAAEASQEIEEIDEEGIEADSEEPEESEGDYKYRILEDGTVEITDYIGNDIELEVPDTLNGKSVTSIGDDAFSWCSKLQNINLPSSVIHVEKHTFSMCENLKNINVADENEKYASQNGILYSKDLTELLRCPQGRSGSVEIPDHVSI